MAGHGGARAGAGRHKGGVSQLNQIMRAAITKGLAHAGREKYGEVVTGDDQEAAAITGAMIISDMIHSGQGADVLKLAAVIQTKDTGSDSQGSTLEDSLKRLPALSRDTFMPSEGDDTEQKPTITTNYNQSPTDTESEVPVLAPESGTFFAPQQSLLMDANPSPAAERQAPPTPPGAPAHTSIDLDSKNFEKSEVVPDPVFELPSDDHARSR
ncbi:hypothetical protein [Endozoicomonas sp. 2B-B]